MRNKIKGILVFVFFIPFFCLKGQSLGIYRHIYPSRFTYLGRVDSSLFEKNKVKLEKMELTRIIGDRGFTHKLHNNFDSSFNIISREYFLNDEPVSFEEIQKKSSENFSYKYKSKKRNSKNKSSYLDDDIKNLKIDRDSFGNKKEIYFNYPSEKESIIIKYDYNYKLKTGKSTIIIRGVKYLRSTLTLNLENKIEYERFFSLNYNTTSYLDLQNAEPYWVDYYEYYENGLTKSHIAKSSKYTYITNHIYE
jgi:hypothetical protein